MRIGFCAEIADITALFTTMKQKQLPHFAKALSDGTLMRKVGEVGMTDREKVIKGLEICTKDIPMSNAVHKSDFCKECPYYNAENRYCWNQIVMMRDALAMLKEQEAEAKWIYGEDKTGVDGWHCSECNFFEPWFYEFTEDIDFIRLYGFCPNCGRKMTSYTGKSVQAGR